MCLEKLIHIPGLSYLLLLIELTVHTEGVRLEGQGGEK
jgi:hypothetical protein